MKQSALSSQQSARAIGKWQLAISQNEPFGCWLLAELLPKQLAHGKNEPFGCWLLAASCWPDCCQSN
jgi:hypothetical protein